MTHIRRREFITLLGGAAAAWPLAAGAQQRPAVPVIGILGRPTAESWATRTAAFLQGLKETGFVEGQNVVIEQRWADGQVDLLPALAAELVRSRVSLIVTVGTNLPARAAKNATSTIPIVFVMGADPVQTGLIDGLSRPGRNITGVSELGSDQIQKRLQLLHDAVPAAKAFGLIINPDNFGLSSSGRTPLELAQDAVRAWGVALHVLQARTVGDLDAAFVSLAAQRIDALATSADTLFFLGQERLVALAAQYAMPMIFHYREAPKAGALMSYSANFGDSYRQAGRYAGRILKGERPGDLPVMLPTKFEFIINLKTAKALNLDIPPGVLAIVDEVIE
jgi:putative ABC transport system substrate-binding protein